ncbi:MAG TPA: TFIIB-type zinc ribbon-containing protein [Thermoplasmata archaeon]|nr:TFIIB-type zinc ribbon-containing protein [Thermoplasmata archaeon]
MPGNAHAGSTFEEEHICPECGSPRLVRDDARGELVCGACGLVLAESAIDEGPERVAHSMEEAEQLARTGPPRKPLSGAAGLTTVVPYPNRDIRGRPIPEPTRKVFYRLRKLQITTAQSGRGERSSVAMGRTLDRVTSQLGLPNTVREEAAFLCRRAIEAGVVRGRSMMGVVAAAVYAACRIDGVPRTLDEMEAVAGISRKAIARHYRELLRTGALRAVPLPRAQEYVSRFCAALGLSSRAQAMALRILGEWDRLGLTGSSSPVGTAATAIYLAAEACGERKHQTEVARVSGVTEVTLRARLALAKQLNTAQGAP